MWKNRTGYVCMLAVMAGMLFHFGRPFLMGMLVLMTVLPLAMAAVLKIDAGKIRVQLKNRTGGKAGQELPAGFQISSDGKLRAAGKLLVEMKISNRMFGTEEERRVLLESTEVEITYPLHMEMPLCGEVSIQCIRIRLYDLLGLFHTEISPFREVHTTIYPESVSLHLELAKQTEGAFSEEGMMQNRKGNDPSEMYDIREYVPGDDVRTIHWKLSSKTDGLILRQPSAAMHYQMALMPDFSEDGQQSITKEEWNRAAAVLIAAGEDLLKSGIPFCMMLPENGELTVTEVQSRRTFREAVSRWMGSPVQKEGAEGVRYFQTAHMEQYFTRLLIVTAGKAYPETGAQLGQLRMVFITADGECERLQMENWKNSTLVKIPVEAEKKGTWSVIC